MQRIHAALEEPLTELGYRREERRYVPHVTLGRVKSDPPTDKLARGLHQYLGWKAGEMEVRELHVMSSELTRSGPLYTVLGRVPL
jgi:2'-5' RNA ligase